MATFLSASIDLCEVDPELVSVIRVRVLLNRVLSFVLGENALPAIVNRTSNGLRGFAASPVRSITTDVIDNTDTAGRSEIYITITGSLSNPDVLDVEEIVKLLTVYLNTQKFWFNTHSRFNRSRDLKHFSQISDITLSEHIKGAARRARAIIVERHRLARTPSGCLLATMVVTGGGDDDSF